MLINLGRKIKQERKAQNLTLKELSIKSGVSISYISDIEHFRKNPSISTFLKLTNALNIKNTYIEEFDDLTNLDNTQQLDALSYNASLSKKLINKFDKIDLLFSEIMNIMVEKGVKNNKDLENFKEILKLNYVLENEKNVDVSEFDKDENVVIFSKYINIMFELFKSYCYLNGISWNVE